MTASIVVSRAEDFIPKLHDNSISLFILDPPYYGIVADEWVNKWKSVDEYLVWMIELIKLSASPSATSNANSATTADGSGKPRCRTPTSTRSSTATQKSLSIRVRPPVSPAAVFR